MQNLLRTYLIFFLHMAIAAVVNGNPTTVFLEAESFDNHGAGNLILSSLKKWDRLTFSPMA